MLEEPERRRAQRLERSLALAPYVGMFAIVTNFYADSKHAAEVVRVLSTQRQKELAGKAIVKILFSKSRKRDDQEVYCGNNFQRSGASLLKATGIELGDQGEPVAEILFDRENDGMICALADDLAFAPEGVFPIYIVSQPETRDMDVGGDYSVTAAGSVHILGVVDEQNGLSWKRILDGK